MTRDTIKRVKTLYNATQRVRWAVLDCEPGLLDSIIAQLQEDGSEEGKAVGALIQVYRKGEDES